MSRELGLTNQRRETVSILQEEKSLAFLGKISKKLLSLPSEGEERMGENSRAAGEYPDELRADYEAALMIATLKYAVVSEEELKEIKKKNEILKMVMEASSADQNPPIISRHSSPDEGYKPALIPPVPSIQEVIGRCSKPFEKQLTESDVRDDQSRVSLNKEYVEGYLFPFFIDGESLEDGIAVTVYDRNGIEFSMMFKIWSGKTCVLNGGWKKFCAAQNLVKLQDFITVWMFRHVQTMKLCFVITSRRLMVAEALHRKRNGKKSKQVIEL